MFRPYDNFGVIEILDFSDFGIITRRMRALFEKELYRYAMTVLLERKEKFVGKYKQWSQEILDLYLRYVVMMKKELQHHITIVYLFFIYIRI